MIPGSLAVMSGAAAATPSFDPATLFAAGEKGAWWDAAAWATTAFQDTAGTTAVTAAGQSIARLNDRSGRGNTLLQATAGQRPTLEISSGLAGVLGDGTDDLLSTGASVNNVFNRITTPWEAFLVFRFNSVGTNSGNPYNNVAILGEVGGWFELAYARSSGLIGAFGGGSNSELRIELSASVTGRHVCHVRYTGTGLQIVASLSGGEETTLALTSQGEAYNGYAAASLQIFKIYNSSYANARFHEIIVRGVAMTSTQRADCINYLKSKWGVA